MGLLHYLLFLLNFDHIILLICPFYYLFTWMPDIIYKTFKIQFRLTLSSQGESLYCFWQVVKVSNNMESP